MIKGFNNLLFVFTVCIFSMFLIGCNTVKKPLNGKGLSSKITDKLSGKKILGYKYLSKFAVPVYSKPNSKSQLVAKINIKAQIPYVERRINWYKILNVKTNNYGWIKANNLQGSSMTLDQRLLLLRKAGYGLSSNGTCRCPDDRTRNGSRCGSRSAFSRAGGKGASCRIKY